MDKSDLHRGMTVIIKVLEVYGKIKDIARSTDGQKTYLAVEYFRGKALEPKVWHGELEEVSIQE